MKVNSNSSLSFHSLLEFGTEYPEGPKKGCTHLQKLCAIQIQPLRAVLLTQKGHHLSLQQPQTSAMSLARRTEQPHKLLNSEETMPKPSSKRAGRKKDKVNGKPAKNVGGGGVVVESTRTG